jgi:hypothetical protein
MMEIDLGVAREAWINDAHDEEDRQKRASSDYLKYKTSAGVFADFHANRRAFITNLAKARVLPKLAQTLARHSDVRLTMDVYTHTELHEEAAAIAMLPRMAKSELTPVKAKVESPLQKLRREKKEAAAARKKANQRSSSVSGAPVGNLGHLTAEPNSSSIGQNRGGESTKSLSCQDLSRADSVCQHEIEVHPPGFEPGTFGSVGSTQLLDALINSRHKVFSLNNLRSTQLRFVTR